jgi:hypothetical protein
MYTAQGAYYEKQVDWVRTPGTRRVLQKMNPVRFRGGEKVKN